VGTKKDFRQIEEKKNPTKWVNGKKKKIKWGASPAGTKMVHVRIPSTENPPLDSRPWLKSQAAIKQKEHHTLTSRWKATEARG